MRPIILFLLLALLAAPQTRNPTNTHKRPPAPAARSGQEIAPDADIERNFRERLARSKLASDKVTISVRGGVATIEGRTEVIQRKGAATRMAKTAGARQVVNKIQLSDEARQKAASNLAKGRRRAQVKRSEVTRR